MVQDRMSQDELLEELEAALVRVNHLQALLLGRSNGEVLFPPHQATQPNRRHTLPEPDSFENTQTLDLTGLFSKDVTLSGSYYTKVFRRTQFGRLMEALPIPAILLSGSREVIFANQAWGRISPDYDRIVGHAFRELFPGASAAQALDAFAESVFARRKIESKETMLAIGDRRIWGRITLRSIRFGNDRFLLALIEDLTTEKRELLLRQKQHDALTREIRRRTEVEQALRESHQRLELALDGADLSSWEWDISAGSLFCDKRFAETLGYAPDEIEPRKDSWEKLVHPDDRPRFQTAIKNHLGGLSTLFECEHRVRTKAGVWKWVLTRGKVADRDEHDNPLRALGTNLDITQRKQSEQKIQLLTHGIIQAVERERERISLELHDQVAQDLAALRLFLETTAETWADANPETRAKIAEASGRLKELVKTVRRMSYHLRPAGLDKLGLVSAVSEYCRDFSDKNQIWVEFSSSGMEELKLDFDTEINLFRVIQESLNNIRKHSRAGKVEIRLTALPSHIELRIRDDGKGFDVERESTAAPAGDKMGLWCMEQRIALLQGRFKIRSNPEEGTEIITHVPYGGHTNAEENKDTDRR